MSELTGSNHRCSAQFKCAQTLVLQRSAGNSPTVRPTTATTTTTVINFFLLAVICCYYSYAIVILVVKKSQQINYTTTVQTKSEIQK